MLCSLSLTASFSCSNSQFCNTWHIQILSRHRFERRIIIKTDAVKFDTNKDVCEISNILSSMKKCQIGDLDKGSFKEGNTFPAIAVLITGKATMADAFKHFGATKSEWGVQVVVFDLEEKRRVLVVALGESQLKSYLNASSRTGSLTSFSTALKATHHINIRHSRSYRDKIAEMIS